MEDDEVGYKCHKYKFFDGDENNREEDEYIDVSWKLDDPEMPEWLNGYLAKEKK